MKLQRLILLYVASVGVPLSALAAGDNDFDGSSFGAVGLFIAVAIFFALPTGIVFLLFWLRDKVVKYKQRQAAARQR